MRLVGIQRQVSNSDIDAIQALWQKFLQMNLKEQLGPTDSDDLYCVYSHYESDHTGPYLMTIGYLTQEEMPSLPELAVIDIPEQKYEKYETQGELPAALVQTWQTIWAKDSSQRAYGYDFDLYPYDQPNTVITFVSIK